VYVLSGVGAHGTRAFKTFCFCFAGVEMVLTTLRRHDRNNFTRYFLIFRGITLLEEDKFPSSVAYKQPC